MWGRQRSAVRHEVYLASWRCAWVAGGWHAHAQHEYLVFPLCAGLIRCTLVVWRMSSDMWAHCGATTGDTQVGSRAGHARPASTSVCRQTARELWRCLPWLANARQYCEILQDTFMILQDGVAGVHCPTLIVRNYEVHSEAMQGLPHLSA